MPQRKSASTLKHLCLVTISRNMDLWCHNKNASRAVELNIVSFFYDLPWELIQNLIKILNKQESFKQAHLCALLRPGMKYLDLASDYVNYSPVDDDFLESVVMKSYRLAVLCLSGCMHISSETLAQLPQSLPELQVLRLAHTRASDAILAAIGHYSHDLRELDVSFCSQLVTDNGIHGLCGIGERSCVCLKLHTLSVELTKVTQIGALHAMKHLPALKRLNGVFIDCDALYQHFKHLKKTDFHETFQIEKMSVNYNQWNQTDFTIATLESAVKLCPNVHVLYVRSRNPLYDFQIAPILALKNLSELCIVNDVVHSEALLFNTVTSILQFIGSHLTSLKLFDVLNLDMSVVGETCPNLEKFFVIYGRIDILHVGQVPTYFWPLTRLSQLHIGYEFLSQGMSYRDLLHVLSCCRQLQIIDLESCQELTDDLIVEVLKVNSFDYLLSLELVCCNNIHVESLVALMSLHNPLHTIKLKYCKSLTKAEYQFLVKLAKSGNLDINIIWNVEWS